MAILCYWDALCWEAGSLVPEDSKRLEILTGQPAAASWVHDSAATAKSHITHEIDIMSADPDCYVYQSGHTYVAIAIALPDEIKSTDEALEWLEKMADEGDVRQIEVVAFNGAGVYPPDGDERRMTKDECLEFFLETLG